MFLNASDTPRAFTWRSLTLIGICMAAAVLLSNVLVQFSINKWLTWGAFSYPLTYFVTDICNRWAGPRLARRVAWIGLIVGASSSLLMAPWRIALASGAAFMISQLLDIAVFNKLRKKSWWKAPLWGSTAATVIDTAIFFSIAFAGTHVSWLHLALGDLTVKLTMAIALLLPFRALIGWLGLMPTKHTAPDSQPASKQA